MARLPRLVIARQLHHVLQWGHNKDNIFLDDVDALQLLEILNKSAARHGVVIHAWVLMPNHFHLLVTPESANSLTGMMQALGRDYVRHFNRRHHRSGTLWAGRYRSALVDANQYLLPCMVFLDLHPVRSGLVESPADYPWSSHRQYVGLPAPSALPRIVPHAVAWHLGNTPFAREAGYRELVDVAFGAEKKDEIVTAIRGGWALGSHQFVQQMQSLTQRRMTKSLAGRPSKSNAPAAENQGR